MMERTRWLAGTVIVQHEVWQRKLWSARPMTVVEDRENLVVLWCPSGTRWKTATTPPVRERASTRAERFVQSLSFGDWVLADFTWEVSTLVLLRPGDWHAVWVSWRESDENWGWYINFQRPFTRTGHSVQTMDLMLDIIVEPDRRWRWKDEDEFDALVSYGIIDATEATHVRQDARCVIEQVEATEPPFSEPWHDWRPDPSWPMPELPEGWDRLEGAEREE